jgi:hypothetical protein
MGGGSGCRLERWAHRVAMTAPPRKHSVRLHAAAVRPRVRCEIAFYPGVFGMLLAFPEHEAFLVLLRYRLRPGLLG